MIPPANMTQEETIGKENEREEREPQSPTSITQQESKLQRLRRSLSFKTKSLRSKSADNFFQRPIEDVKFQTELLSDVSSSTGHLSTIGLSVSTPPAMSIPPPPPPLPPVIPGNLPITICSPSRAPRQMDPNAHTFLEHIFKKPHFCDMCNHMIVGPNAKLGLRCKACKMGIHHKCLDRVGQQKCNGKLPKGFRRYSSSPLLIQEQFGCIREVMPIACSSKVDPVYETLRFGTSLAQKNKRTSGSESPKRNSTSDVGQIQEERAADSIQAQLTRKPSDNVFTNLENGAEPFHVAEMKSEDSPGRPEHTFYSSEFFLKGVIDDRIGFFPVSYTQQLKAGDRVFRCNRTFIGCKEQGQITLKEGQICVSSEDESNGFISVASGKKRGFVPCDVLENK
ncbi:SH3 and cysteine-rich domain-containing protein [Triplophysa tibetana]|uniref:SH3 and cysteine-rich domain-containing protein n=1 Tax=Triplophysa tibetana TaxID=1572043 RepID=A0A5A9NSE8_9TELE|nr:SH3 and cysteine-rich domain-containing protein [Triplophysa tibetana]